MSKPIAKARFDPGRWGACEATLYSFSGESHPGSPEGEVHRIAADKLADAVVYLEERHKEFQVRRVDFLGIITLVSGSNLD